MIIDISKITEKDINYLLNLILPEYKKNAIKSKKITDYTPRDYCEDYSVQFGVDVVYDFGCGDWECWYDFFLCNSQRGFLFNVSEEDKVENRTLYSNI